MKTVIQIAVCAISLYIVSAVTCPDQSQCGDGQTCCKLTSGGYGCCPYPSATCCSDGLHCCPNKYTCDVAHGKCIPQSLFATLNPNFAEMRTKVPTVKKILSVDDCPSGQTQCPGGCCPLPNAYCCADNISCCPDGTVLCIPPFCFKSVMDTQILTKLSDSLKVEDCPSGQTQCPAGCCPLPSAVCCSDNLHCCPQGTTCQPPYCVSMFDRRIKFSSVPIKN